MAKFKHAKTISKSTNEDYKEFEPNEDDIESSRSQLKKLFQSVRNPGKSRVWAKNKSKFLGTVYLDYLNELIAKDFGCYSIKQELRKKFGRNKIFTTRNILGYIRTEILMNPEITNLNLISRLRYRYKVDRSDSHFEIEKEVKEIRKNQKTRIEELSTTITDLYARIEIMKEENKGKFSSNTEKQISQNYELIESFSNQLRVLEAEQQGISLDYEQVRADTIQTILGMCIQHLLPHIPETKQQTVLFSLKSDIKNWANTSTKLNKLSKVMESGSRGMIPNRIVR